MTRPGPVTPDSGDELVRDIRVELTATIEVALVGRGVPLDVVGAVHQFVDHLMAAVDENARADERNRIADAIEAEAAEFLKRSRNAHQRNEWVLPGIANAHANGLRAAARIARGETP